MEHSLISTIIASIVTAFIFGMVAKKLKLPAIFGYLLAGVAIGPHTPGFVADVTIAKQLAEIGIILLMFGVGLHFSIRDLMKMKKIVLPGALFQIITATLIGGFASLFLLKYTFEQSFIFGFSLSIASSIVLLRSLEHRRALESEAGKIATGWLIIQDLVMVLALVLLPVAAQVMSGDRPVEPVFILTKTLEIIFKIGGFAAFMFIIGRRFLPWLLVAIAKMRSSELSTLGTLAIALGFALIANTVFDASLALGAFLAGMVLNESEIGRKSAQNSLPMRDAFSVLFFVSVGMLFNPTTLFTQPLAVALTLFIIVFANSIASLIITKFFKQSSDVCCTVAIGLAQIGEFSFILGSIALFKRMITDDIYNLILAGAMLSIVINPFLFRAYDYLRKSTS